MKLPNVGTTVAEHLQLPLNMRAFITRFKLKSNMVSRF